MALSGRCLGRDSAKYSPILPKFSPKVVLEQTKGLFEKFLKDLSFYGKKDGPKLSIFGPTLTARFALKIAEMEKIRTSAERLHLLDY